MNETTEEFVALVKEYCRWAESVPNNETEELKTAIRLVANLYSKVLELPKNGCGEEINESGISNEKWKKIFKRFGALPFNYYSEFFSPAKVAEEDPVTGDLADDLADIYRDLKEGLELYEEGHVTEAIWEWSQRFNTHWGRHASSALHALHAYAADEYIEL